MSLLEPPPYTRPQVDAKLKAITAEAAQVALPNTFTAAMTIRPAQGGTPLTVEQPDPAVTDAISVQSRNKAFTAGHDVDWSAETVAPHDLVNLFHRSTGDAIFAVHQGGRKPGMQGVAGGNAVFNAYIPYYLDDVGQGTGTIVNDRTGMQGLFIQSLAKGDEVKAISVVHAGGGPAMVISNQAGGNAGNGNGAAVVVDDYGTRSALTIAKGAVPSSTSIEATVRLGTVGLPKETVIRHLIAGGPSGPTFTLYSNGRIILGISPNHGAAMVSKDTRLPFVGTQLEMGGEGMQRNVAITNAIAVDGAGVQTEMNIGGVQMALLRAARDNADNGSLRLSARSNGRVTDRIHLNGTGLGFFGAPPVARPSRVAVDVQSIHAALVSLGLIAA